MTYFVRSMGNIYRLLRACKPFEIELLKLCFDE